MERLMMDIMYEAADGEKKKVVLSAEMIRERLK